MTYLFIFQVPEVVVVVASEAVDSVVVVSVVVAVP